MDNLEEKTYEKSSLSLRSQSFKIIFTLHSALKAYMEGSEFGLSSGTLENCLNETILEWENGKIFCEVKHQSPDTVISEVNIFKSNGNFSLIKNLGTYYNKNFTSFLDDIEERIRVIRGNLLEQNKNGDIEIILLSLSNVRNNNSFKEYLDVLLKFLPKLNDELINRLVLTHENSSLRMVTNIFPNDKLCNTFQDFSVHTGSGLALGHNWKCLKFNTKCSLEKLSKVVKKSRKEIPEDIIKVFLSKFILISVPEKTLQTNIYELLEPLCSEYDIDNKYDFFYHLYVLFEEWRVQPEGTYITRRILENNFFTRVVSSLFIEKLKRMKGVLCNNINSVWANIRNYKLTVIQTDYYELLMKGLQSRFQEEDIDNVVFLDPMLDENVRQKVTSAFLHNDSTHIVCMPCGIDSEMLDKIINNNHDEKEKKIILIYEEEIETRPQKNRMFDENLGSCSNLHVTDVVYDNNVKEKTLIQINTFYSPLNVRFLKKFISQAQKLFVIEVYSHSSCFSLFTDDTAVHSEENIDTFS